MTILQSVCAILMGLYVLSLCRKYFDAEMLDEEQVKDTKPNENVEDMERK